MKRKPKHQLRRSTHKRFHGLTVPGYNYCGPFNSNDNGEPVNKDDAGCKKHDLSDEYKDYKGYIFFNDADEELIQDLKDSTTFTGKVAKRYFEWKKRVMPRMRKRTGYKTPSRKGDTPATDKDTKTPSTEGDTPPTEKNTPAEILRDPHQFSSKYKKTFIEWATDLEGHPTSVRNIQPSAQDTMPEGQNAGAKETPLDPIVDIERGVPSWQYASLPYNHSWVWQGHTLCYDWGYRMTSPLNADISVNDAVDLNSGAGRANVYGFKPTDTPGDGSKAMWFDFYASIYKYYSVVGCRYNILIENLSHEDIWVHEMFVSKTTPPLEADNNDILNWPNVKSHYVRSIGAAIAANNIEKQNEPVNKSNEGDDVQMGGTTANFESQNHIRNEGSSIIKLSGHYRPGDYTRDIAQDADVERWTAVDQSPTLREALLLRFKPTRNFYNNNNADNYDRYLTFKITTQLEYLVEFKELKDGLKWPIKNQPAVVSINTTDPGTKK